MRSPGLTGVNEKVEVQVLARYSTLTVTSSPFVFGEPSPELMVSFRRRRRGDNGRRRGEETRGRERAVDIGDVVTGGTRGGRVSVSTNVL